MGLSLKQIDFLYAFFQRRIIGPSGRDVRFGLSMSLVTMGQLTAACAKQLSISSSIAVLDINTP